MNKVKFISIIIAVTDPPIAIEPVSPINTDAGFELKAKYPINTPAKINAVVEILAKVVLAIKNTQKNTGIETEANKPSIPSVKFTAFVVPTNTNIKTGITNMPKLIFILKNGTIRYPKLFLPM